MIDNGSIAVIESCLRVEFPGYQIVGEHAKEGGYLFRLILDELSHVLYMDVDAVSDKDAETLKTFFYDCDVASVLRNVGEFTVSLTDSGCIFGNP